MIVYKYRFSCTFEDLIQKFYLSALQLGGWGSPPQPCSQAMESGWELQLCSCVWRCLRVMDPQRPESEAAAVLPVELPKWFWQIPNAGSTYKLQWSLKNWKLEKVKETEDYDDCLLFVNNFSNAFYCWRKIYTYHPRCIFPDW